MVSGGDGCILASEMLKYQGDFVDLCFCLSDTLNMKKLLCLEVFFLLAVSVFAADLSIGKEDVRIIQSPEGGYHLYIRKKADINSVLLTETTRDPTLQSDNYAYRLLFLLKKNCTV